jgi:hypothetical protein
MQLVGSYIINGKYSTIDHRRSSIYMKTNKNDDRRNNKRVTYPNSMYTYISIDDLKAWQLIS